MTKKKEKKIYPLVIILYILVFIALFYIQHHNNQRISALERMNQIQVREYNPVINEGEWECLQKKTVEQTEIIKKGSSEICVWEYCIEQCGDNGQCMEDCGNYYYLNEAPARKIGCYTNVTESKVNQTYCEKYHWVRGGDVI